MNAGRAGLKARGEIEPQRRQRSAADLLTQYFEVHFDDVAAELAAAGPGPPEADSSSLLRQRELAASQLRQFIRGLIQIRAGAQDRDAVLEVVGGMDGLTSYQRDMLRDRVDAVLARVDARPEVIRGPAARSPGPPAEEAGAEQAASMPAVLEQPADEPEQPAAELDAAAEAEPGAGGESEPEAEAQAAEAEPAADGQTAEVRAAQAEVAEARAAEAESAAQFAAEGIDGEAASALQAEPVASDNGGGSLRSQSVQSYVTPAPTRALGPRRSAAPVPPSITVAETSAATVSVLNALVVKCQEEVGADICQVFIIDDDSRLTLRAEAPSEGGTITGPRVLSHTEGFAAKVSVGSGPVVLRDHADLAAAEAAWHERGVVSLSGVRVGTTGEPGSGMLVAARTSARPFGDDELRSLADLAAEVTLAMASADLVARAEELAVLKERMKLAREIHDGLASDLSAVVALFKYHDHRRQMDPSDADTLLLQMRELVEGSLQNARDILATLRPRQRVPRRLAEAARHHVEDFSQTYGITAITRILGEDDNLDEEERDALYQVLREALTNVRKHSEAGTIYITLDLRRRPFSLVVEDDGVGIDPDAVENKAGSFGLLGIRERAELLGGSVEVSNGGMGGARVAFYGPPVPLARA